MEHNVQAFSFLYMYFFFTCNPGLITPYGSILQIRMTFVVGAGSAGGWDEGAREKRQLTEKV